MLFAGWISDTVVSCSAYQHQHPYHWGSCWSGESNRETLLPKMYSVKQTHRFSHNYIVNDLSIYNFINCHHAVVFGICLATFVGLRRTDLGGDVLWKPELCFSACVSGLSFLHIFVHLNNVRIKQVITLKVKTFSLFTRMHDSRKMKKYKITSERQYVEITQNHVSGV